MSAFDTIRELLQSAAFDGDDDETPSESITYTPSGGDARSIRAIIHREQADPYGNARSPRIRIMVLNDATTGISSTEIDVGADSISVAERPGQNAAARSINRILIQNDAFLQIEVR